MVQELAGTFAVVALRGIFGSVGSVIERQQKMHQQGCNHFVAGNELRLLNGDTKQIIVSGKHSVERLVYRFVRPKRHLQIAEISLRPEQGIYHIHQRLIEDKDFHPHIARGRNRIDDATYRAAVESANANVQMMTAALNRAQLEYDGKKTLRQQEIISDFELSLAESDLNVAKANLAAAKAALTSARNDLSYTEIRSPSDGVVGRIPYRKGDLVGPSIQDGLTVAAQHRHHHRPRRN